MKNIKGKIFTILLGLVALGIIACTLGPIAYTFFSIVRDIDTWESQRNYRYVYAIPKTSLFLQTYFHNDSLYTFVGNDTIIDNCSYFGVRYISDLTLVVLDVVNDSLVYLADHSNDVDSICNKGVTIEHISNGFDNHDFYDQRYTEESILYYVPKFHQLTRVSIYSGRVRTDSVIKPIMIKRERKRLSM